MFSAIPFAQRSSKIIMVVLLFRLPEESGPTQAADFSWGCSDDREKEKWRLSSSKPRKTH